MGSARWRLRQCLLVLVLVTSVLVAAPFAGGRPEALAAEPPLGTLVPGTANFGWTRGEFSVSGDGAAEYRLPIWLPDGRGNVRPDLNLSFNSRQGNGLLGVGWSLDGLSSISWCRRNFAQDGFSDGAHFDGSSALCLGGKRLLPRSDPQLPQRDYTLEQEDFSLITAFGNEDSVPDHFLVVTKDGRKLTYGETDDSRSKALRLQRADFVDPSLERAPGDPVTVSWALNKIEDTNGNVTTVQYDKMEGSEAELWWTHRRPSSIQYPPGRKVEFHYAERRPDKIDSYTGGVHTRIQSLLTAIHVKAGPEGQEPQLLRRYDLSYQNNSITGRRLLSQITECDLHNVCLRPLPLTWTFGTYNFEVFDAGVALDRNNRIEFVDVNGDGRDDLLSGDQLYLSTGNGFNAGSFSGLDHGPGRLVDVDFDGRSDTISRVAEGGPDGTPGSRPTLFRSDGSRFIEVLGNLDEWRPDGANSVRGSFTADLDGNGLADYVAATWDDRREPGRWRYRLNTGAAGPAKFAPTQESSTPRNLPTGNFSVDINGDGRVEIASSSVGTGIPDPDGRPGWEAWGLNVLGGVENASVNIWGGSTQTHFGDLNGDGLQDAVKPYNADPRFPPGSGVSGLMAQINSGNGFGARAATASPPGWVEPGSPFNDDRGVRVADFNGDGRDDVVVYRGGDPSGPDDTTRGLQVYLWTPGGFVHASVEQQLIPDVPQGFAGWQFIQPADIDGNGVLDLVSGVNVEQGDDEPRRLTIFRRIGDRPDQLIGIGDTAFRDRVTIVYTTLNDYDTHIPADTCTYPAACLTKGSTIVKSHHISTRIGGTVTWDTYNHRYSGARMNLRGRGWLGFATHTVDRAMSGASTTTEFDNTTTETSATREFVSTLVYPYAHRPKKITHTIKDSPAGREFSQTTEKTFAFHRHAGGSHTVEEPTVTTTERERAVGETAWTTLRENITENTYDNFGNVELTVSRTTGGRTVTADPFFRDETAAARGLVSSTKTTSCTVLNVCQTRESSFDYDANRNPTVTITEPNSPSLKLTTTTTYEQFGLIKTVERRGKISSPEEGQPRIVEQTRTDTFEYPANDKLYPSATINAAGHKTVVETHNGLGVPLSTTDPNGLMETMSYDGFGRLRSTHRSDGSIALITHSVAADRAFQHTDTNVSGGGFTRVVEDRLGRTTQSWVKTFNGQFAIAHTEYDDRGRVSRQSRPAVGGQPLQHTTTVYDNRDRVVSVTAPDNVQVRHGYINRETSTTDGKGETSRVVANPDGDIEASFEPDPSNRPSGELKTGFEYWPFGGPHKVTAADGTVRVATYDVLGRPETQTDPSRGVTTTSYTAFGEVVRAIDGEGNRVDFRYDELGRVRKKTAPEGDTTWNYDTAAHGIGKIVSARSADGVGIDYRYNPLGKPSTTTWDVGGTQFEVAYDYDAIGRQNTLTYPRLPGTTDRLKIAYVYNQHGYLSQIKDAATGLDPCTNEDRTAGLCYWTADNRNSEGNITKEILGNGVVTDIAYTPSTGIPNGITTTGPGTIGKIGEISYVHDANRNVRERHDNVNNRHEVFDYDPLNRLTGWSGLTMGSPQVSVRASYNYDAVGNLTSETVRRSGQPDATITYAYGGAGAPPHALTSRSGVTYTYDRAGRQKTGDGRTIEYNSNNLPKSIVWAQNQRTEMAYDPDGARVRKVDNGQALISIAGLFEMQDPGGSGNTQVHSKHYIAAEGRVVAQVTRIQEQRNGPVTGSKTWYLHQDLLGSTSLITNQGAREPDEADHGWLRNLTYDPWGRRLDTNNQPLPPARRGVARLGFTGHEHDDELELIHMQGRAYDPKQRRFLTPDPIIQRPLSSQNQNRFAYVFNNPTTNTDPTGFQTCAGCSTLAGLSFSNTLSGTSYIISILMEMASQAAGQGDPLEGELTDSAEKLTEASISDDDLARTPAGDVIVIDGRPGRPMFTASGESFTLWLWQNKVEIAREAFKQTLTIFAEAIAGAVGTADAPKTDAESVRIKEPRPTLLDEALTLPIPGMAGAGQATRLGRVGRLVDDIADTAGNIRPRGATVPVYHGSINDATTIRTKGLDPSRTPTWVTRDKNAALDAIGPKRIDRMNDPGLIEARIPRGEFERVMLPNERVYYGWGSDGPATTEIVLRTPTQVELFNRYMVGGQ